MINFDKISFVVSVGTHCYTSWLMQKMKIRQCSLPFDWLFSDLRMVADCIRDDFELFLDRSMYYVADGDGHCGHKVYSEKYQRPIIFNHHDVANNDDHFQHFVRAVGRLRKICSSGDPKLFLAVADEFRAADAMVADLQDAIHSNIGNAHVVVITRKMIKAAAPIVMPPRKVGRAAVIDFQETSEMVGGLAYKNDADNQALVNIFECVNWDIQTPEPAID